MNIGEIEVALTLEDLIGRKNANSLIMTLNTYNQGGIPFYKKFGAVMTTSYWVLVDGSLESLFYISDIKINRDGSDGMILSQFGAEYYVPVYQNEDNAIMKHLDFSEIHRIKQLNLYK